MTPITEQLKAEIGKAALAHSNEYKSISESVVEAAEFDFTAGAEWMAKRCEVLIEGLQALSVVTEPLFQSCSAPGHTQYSSMQDDRVCEKCNCAIDGPGGTICVHAPTWSARQAQEILAKFMEGR